ncbi:unnamed protein product [Pylaiella littoralis]
MNGSIEGEINHRVQRAHACFRRNSQTMYDRPGAPLRLKVRLLQAEVVETLLYGCHMESEASGVPQASVSPPLFPPSLHRMEKEGENRPTPLLRQSPDHRGLRRER